MRKEQGRLLELPILIVLALAGAVWLMSVAPILGASLMALIGVAVIVLFARRWLEVHRIRSQCRTRLEKAAADLGLELGVRMEGKPEIHGGMLGLDPSRRKIVYASPQAAAVLDYAQVRSVSLGKAHALGAATPSWYSIGFSVEGQKETLAVSTKSRGEAGRWLYELGYALGEDIVKDACAELE